MDSDDSNLPKSAGKFKRRRAEVEIPVGLVRPFPANTAFEGCSIATRYSESSSCLNRLRLLYLKLVVYSYEHLQIVQIAES